LLYDFINNYLKFFNEILLLDHEQGCQTQEFMQTRGSLVNLNCRLKS